jgi:putative hydrolase of the HAD superfamily
MVRALLRRSAAAVAPVATGREVRSAVPGVCHRHPPVPVGPVAPYRFALGPPHTGLHARLWGGQHEEDRIGVIEAVLFDFGGVVTSSPFDAFARYERQNGLPVDLIRTINSTDPDTNAWSHFERGDLEFDEFCARFETEARDLGYDVDAREIVAGLSGELRPRMVEAIRRCSERFKTGCLTNNFSLGSDRRQEVAHVFGLFHVVLESSKLGVRKPEPRFYEMACEALEVSADEAVYLDDLGINLKPARALGMKTIKVQDPSIEGYPSGYAHAECIFLDIAARGDRSPSGQPGPAHLGDR